MIKKVKKKNIIGFKVNIIKKKSTIRYLPSLYSQ